MGAKEYFLGQENIIGQESTMGQGILWSREVL